MPSSKRGCRISRGRDASRPPAYVGDRIDVRAELVSIRSRRLVFRVQARNGHVVVGSGLHERAIIDKSTLSAPGGS